jgi:hypothetical protein
MRLEPLLLPPPPTPGYFCCRRAYCAGAILVPTTWYYNSPYPVGTVGLHDLSAGDECPHEVHRKANRSGAGAIEPFWFWGSPQFLGISLVACCRTVLLSPPGCGWTAQESRPTEEIPIYCGEPILALPRLKHGTASRGGIVEESPDLCRYLHIQLSGQRESRTFTDKPMIDTCANRRVLLR